MNRPALLASLQSKLGSANFNDWTFNRWQFYDYSIYPGAGVTELPFFANPLGSQDPNATAGSSKTLEDTNVNTGRKFGQVYYFITEIRTHLNFAPKNRQPSAIASDADLLLSTWGNCMEEVANLFQSGVLQISIGQKGYFDIVKPLLQAPPGFGVEIDQPATITTFNQIVTQGYRRMDTYVVDPIQMIEPDQTFNASIVYPDGIPVTFTNTVNSATPLLKIGLIFDGFIARPVQ